MRDWRCKSEQICRGVILAGSLLMFLLSGCGSDAQDVELNNAVNTDMTILGIEDAGKAPVQDMTPVLLPDIASADATQMVDASTADMGISESPDGGEDNLLDQSVEITTDMGAESDLSVEIAPDVGTEPDPRTDADRNGDNQINILVLGSTASISGGQAFSPQPIAVELRNILNGATDMTVNVLAEDIHNAKPVTLGLGQNGAEYTYTHHSHSLAQYYYWPDGQAQRWANLASAADVVWDHVVIGADPHIVSTLPGYYALGMNKVASKVSEGGAQPWLLTVWDWEQPSDRALPNSVHVARRIAAGASVDLKVVPVRSAWRSLPEELRDAGNVHPTPNAAYLAAAAIYFSITNESAAASNYIFNDDLAVAADEAVRGWDEWAAPPDPEMVVTPFSACAIDEEVISYNHTGTSSERGILGGLNWVFNQAPQQLQNGGETPINFNYGRANSNFEVNKRYRVDPERFQFSLGFPMQDNGNHGNESMLYGLDRRDSGTLNDTDLGVALFMVYQSEVPSARAVPIRTLFAQMREAMPDQSAYRDRWHMNSDLDRASGAFMYTLLTNQCVVGSEPETRESAEWRSWTAHRIGSETAWTLMHLEAVAGCPE